MFLNLESTTANFGCREVRNQSREVRDQSLFMAWGGGGDWSQKRGGHRIYFEVQRVDINKKLRSHEWASKKFPPKNFRCCRSIFKQPQLPFHMY